MSLITIDNNTYDVGEVSLSRAFELVVDDLTSGEMLDSSIIEDIVATKIEYSITIQPKRGNFADYDAFVHDITTPKSRRIITVPYGQETITFPANVVSADDSLIRAYKYNKWGELTITFKPLTPQRYAE